MHYRVRSGHVPRSLERGTSLFLLGIIMIQLSSLRTAWLHSPWVLFLIGTAFAATITRFASLHLFLQNRGLH
ncbi:MAG: hypothetical protein HY560_00260 [Gemmatimonadetes bacterium]|nr:hypothetical protein [Gemmatimonadota bacterium]